MDLSPPKQFIMLVAATTTATLLANMFLNAAKLWALDEFIDPDAFADIAAQLPQDPSEYALEAWDLVGRQIPYSHYGSILHFGDDYARCKRCHLPLDIVRRGRGNCVAKSQVLVSLLRNRFSASDTYMAIGQLNVNGTGGHAWVILNHNGWHILESTMPPPDQPWVSASRLSEIYIPEAMVNDRGLVCLDEEICHLVHRADSERRADLVVNHPCPRSILSLV